MMGHSVIRLAAFSVFGILSACTEQTPSAPEPASQAAEAKALASPETTLQSGLQYMDLVAGSGREVREGDTVDVQYSSWIYRNGRRGEMVDSSIVGRPFTITIGLTSVIQGWNEGISGMRVGGKRKLIVPPHLGYGTGSNRIAVSGDPAVPANATLEYEIELLDFPHFDLGGPCFVIRQYRPLALTRKQQDELHQAGNWEALIDAARQDVRSNCSIPYRWEQLFKVLVEGHRYHDAVQVLSDMSMRRFPMPHAILAKADPAFITSNEFRTSAFGMQYMVTENEHQRNMRLAESKLSSMDEKSRPPSPYRARGACPFECCTYREWTTKSAVQLRDSIGSATIVAEIPANTRVDGLTGEVHVEPEPYAILQDIGSLQAGDVIFFLDYQGEGHVNYWYNGQVNPFLGLQDDGLYSYTYENCSANSVIPGACSLRKLRPEKKFLNEWWVKIRTIDGKEGWALNTGQFDNTDACG